MKAYRTIAIAGVAVLAIVAATGSESGAEEVVYHACVNDSSGAIFIVAGPDDCKKHHTHILWNQVGPTGSTGPVGPQGPEGSEGPMGPPGPAGLSEPRDPSAPSGVLGFYQRTVSQTVAPGGTVRLTASCDYGDTATGGGYSSSSDLFRAGTNMPGGDRRWFVSGMVLGQAPTALTISAYVICADTSM